MCVMGEGLGFFCFRLGTLMAPAPVRQASPERTARLLNSQAMNLDVVDVRFLFFLSSTVRALTRTARSYRASRPTGR